MAASELVTDIRADDRLIIFRPVKDPDGVTRYRAMRVGWSVMAALIADEAKARAEGDKGLGDRLKAVEDAALRSEVLAGVVKTSGAPVAVTFSKAFAKPPTLIPLPTWSGDQIIESGVVNVSETGASIMVKRSRGTLLLTTGPFENAPAGTAFAMLAIGH